MRRATSLTAAVLAACGDNGSEDDGFKVTSEVVRDETTKDILVFTPDAEGTWPVIVAFHGIGGTAEDMA